MGVAYLNGKAGVWRTVGGRKIFIANGQSLRDAMKASGKFKNLNNDTEENRKKTNKMVDIDEAEAKEAYEKAKDKWDYARNRYDSDSEKYKEAKKAYEEAKDRYTEAGKTSSEYYASEAAKANESKTKVPEKYLERGEMMNLVDKWSEKGFDEEGAYGNSGGKGVLHERWASGQLEGYGGDADDFIIKDFDLGSADPKIALNALNQELNKKGYQAQYLKDEWYSHQDIEIKKIKTTPGKSIIKQIDEIDYDTLFRESEDDSSLKIGRYHLEGGYNYNPRNGRYDIKGKRVAVWQDDNDGEVKYYANLDSAKNAIKGKMTKSLSQLTKVYMNEGYTKETAKKMAEQDIKDRK